MNLKKKDKMKAWLNKYWWSIAALVIALGFPFLVNFLLRYDFQTADKLDNTHWLGFWGSYLGGLVGSIAALIALGVTIHSQEVYHREAQEAERLHLLPAVICTFIPMNSPSDVNTFFIVVNNDVPVESFTTITEDLAVSYLKKKYSSFNTNLCVHFNIENIGIGPAFDVSISLRPDVCSVPIGCISVGKSFSCKVFLSEKKSYTFYVTFKDTHGNQYQTSTLLNPCENGSIDFATGRSTSPVLLS